MPIILFNFVNIEKLILNDQRAAAEDSRQGIGMGIPALGDEKQSVPAVSATSGQSAPIRRSLLLTATWLIVALVLFGRTAYVNIGVLSHARRLRPLIDGEVLNLLENCKSELRVPVPASVVVTEKVQSPALLGFIRPRLLLPEQILKALTPAELRHVFLHELAHIKRLDIFSSWLITFVQILHWFNPIYGREKNQSRLHRRPASGDDGEWEGGVRDLFED